MKTEQCGACRFFKVAGESWGGCRRYPPVMLYVPGDDIRAIWTEVDADNWCGEFKPVPDATDGD